VLFLFTGAVALLLLGDLAYADRHSFVETIGSPAIRQALALSLVTSVIAAVLAVLVAVPAGYALSRYPPAGALLLDTVVDATIVLPPLVVGISLLVFFRLGQDMRAAEAIPVRGLGQLICAVGERLIYTKPGIVVAQFFVCAGYAFRSVKAGFDATDRRLETVARTLGSGPLGAFWRVAVPTAMPSIVAGAVLSWARAFGVFGPVMVFAGAVRGKTEVLPTAIYLEISIGRLEAALAIALLMIAVSFAVLVLFKRFAHTSIFGPARGP
jgi:molybdate transport system permease protein